ncbi:hypothetical protein HK100_012195 [Physocladia obscura]|uniref:C2H2-type domain-containing protein n=1 Tax=Physocladia obscura TaxID=109957 RepID=A0AAD5T124_9FUNG|nr:hypothetical protein HK100_012195 [Physocladia obscura]
MRGILRIKDLIDQDATHDYTSTPLSPQESYEASKLQSTTILSNSACEPEQPRDNLNQMKVRMDEKTNGIENHDNFEPRPKVNIEDGGSFAPRILSYNNNQLMMQYPDYSGQLSPILPSIPVPPFRISQTNSCIVCGHPSVGVCSVCRKGSRINMWFFDESEEYPYICEFETCTSKFRRLKDLRRHLAGMKHRVDIK